MDLPDMGPGAIAYFPVQHEGASSMSATATAPRATASSAASRSRSRRPPRSTST
ncbi:MAG: hypothetical protein R3D25_10750 [Geminicoccaceae bacterium]